MPGTVRIALEAGLATRLEVGRSERSVDGWRLALIVPEPEIARFGQVNVLDLLELAGELEEAKLWGRAA